MTATKKEKPAAESEARPSKGTELGITTSLSRRRIELSFVQGISLAGDNSALGGLSGHQELAVLKPPVVAPRIRLPRTLVSSMQGIEANRLGLTIGRICITDTNGTADIIATTGLWT